MTIVGRILKGAKAIATGAVQTLGGALSSGLKGAVQVVKGDVKGGLSTAVAGTFKAAKESATKAAIKTIETMKPVSNDVAGVVATQNVISGMNLKSTSGNTGVVGYVPKATSGLKRDLKLNIDQNAKTAYAQQYNSIEKVNLGGSQAIVEQDVPEQDIKSGFKLTLTHAVVGVLLLLLGFTLFKNK